MSLLRLFDSTLLARSAHSALDLGSRTLSFRDIEARSNGTAHTLASRGLGPGDRLVVQLANRLEFLDLFLACLKIGAIFVPVSVLYREREVGHIVGDAEPVAVVTTPALAGLVLPGTAVWDVDELAAEARGHADASPPESDAARAGGLVIPRSTVRGGRRGIRNPGGSLGTRRVEVFDNEHEPKTVSRPRPSPARQFIAQGDPRSARPGTRDDSPAAIVYTSGTTGRAKGAVLTHGNLAANARTLVEAWRITAADRYLAVLPLFHVHGLGNGVCSWLASGCRMRLVERFEHDRAEALFEEFRPTLFFGVPTVYVRLLELPDEAARRIGERMRLFVSGSAPLPAPVFEAFRRKFGHAILERYGMTETLMTIGNPYDGERRPGTVGRPLPGVEVRIVGREGRDVADGENGELLVRGPAVFARLLATARGHRRRLRGRVVSHRRPRGALGRRLRDSPRARERPDHQRGLQRLPPGDRGRASRAARSARGRRGRDAGRAPG